MQHQRARSLCRVAPQREPDAHGDSQIRAVPTIVLGQSRERMVGREAGHQRSAQPLDDEFCPDVVDTQPRHVTLCRNLRRVGRVACRGDELSCLGDGGADAKVRARLDPPDECGQSHRAAKGTVVARATRHVADQRVHRTGMDDEQLMFFCQRGPDAAQPTRVIGKGHDHPGSSNRYAEQLAVNALIARE